MLADVSASNSAILSSISSMPSGRLSHTAWPVSLRALGPSLSFGSPETGLSSISGAFSLAAVSTGTSDVASRLACSCSRSNSAVTCLIFSSISSVSVSRSARSASAAPAASRAPAMRVIAALTLVEPAAIRATCLSESLWASTNRCRKSAFCSSPLKLSMLACSASTFFLSVPMRVSIDRSRTKTLLSSALFARAESTLILYFSTSSATDWRAASRSLSIASAVFSSAVNWFFSCSFTATEK
mmetsp:Transcript_25/g.70  ORF Transcript_25/g.70 Transcript_25/m.70 type:complete len:242 (-) Transcript_25:1972-2697(-)